MMWQGNGCIMIGLKMLTLTAYQRDQLLLLLLEFLGHNFVSGLCTVRPKKLKKLKNLKPKKTKNLNTFS